MARNLYIHIYLKKEKPFFNFIKAKKKVFNKVSLCTIYKVAQYFYMIPIGRKR